MMNRTGPAWYGLAFLIGCLGLAVPAGAANLKLMNVGVGSGAVSSVPLGISCGATCDFGFGAVSVTLTAAASPGSTFSRWLGDCSSAGTSTTCTLNLSADRVVRAEFQPSPAIPEITDFTPTGLQAYLTANPTVNTPARFLDALPAEFKRNWILMSRSESLQTGTAETPRLLFPSTNSQFVFTYGLQTHTAYPGSHPNAIEYMQWDATEKNGSSMPDPRIRRA